MLAYKLSSEVYIHFNTNKRTRINITSLQTRRAFICFI